MQIRALASQLRIWMGEQFYDFNSIFARENPVLIQIDAKLNGRRMAAKKSRKLSRDLLKRY